MKENSRFLFTLNHNSPWGNKLYVNPLQIKELRYPVTTPYFPEVSRSVPLETGQIRDKSRSPAFGLKIQSPPAVPWFAATAVLPIRRRDKPFVLIAVRISGRPGQKEASLEDQVDHAHEIAQEIFGAGSYDFHICSVIVTGERLDRADLREIEKLLSSGKVNLFLVEDVGRLVRGTKAKDLFCLAADKGTRAIAINNGIDTNVEDWESKLIKQCGEEVAANETASRRIKFKCLNALIDGGLAQRRAGSQ